MNIDAPEDRPDSVADADLTAIEVVIEDYFEGMYLSDTKRLERAFHPNARIAGYDEGTLIDNPIDKFIAFVGKVTPPSDEGEPFEMEIISVDIQGAAAAVKVKDLYKGLRFTDYLSLLKVDGTWKIVSKTFSHLPRT